MAVVTDSEPARPKWKKILANVGFVALVIPAFSYYVTARDVDRQNRTMSAIRELCYGMQTEEVHAVMKSNGVIMYPWRNVSFQDRPFGVLDVFDPSVKITQFWIAGKDGLWLVKTTNFRFFIDDTESKEHHLNKCDWLPRY